MKWILGVCVAIFTFLLFAGSGFCGFASLEEALPAYGPGEEIVVHSAYTLKYDERYEQANWVAYILTAERAAARATRVDDFRSDPDVPTGSATLKDYRGSGYDRGHLAPAADMKWSPRAQSECFYMSNMSPQVPAFNRGIWNSLEMRVRQWAIENGELVIVTGPVLSEGLPVIGPDRVAVPRFFYKVLLDYRAPVYKAIGFIMPNEGSDAPLSACAVTVDSVESFTGIDFYPSLPDSLERTLEGTLRPSEWHLPGGVQVAEAQPVAPSGAGVEDAPGARYGRNGPAPRRIFLAAAALVIIALIVWVILVALGEAFGLFRKKR